MNSARRAVQLLLALGCCISCVPTVAADEGKISADERAKVIKLLKDSQAETLEALEKLSDTQLKFKPAPERWSVLECAEHIMLAEGQLFSAVQRAIATKPNPDWEAKTKGKTELLEDVLAGRKGKAQAPESIVPSGKLSRGEVIQKFKEARAVTLKFAEQTQVPLKGHTLDHPFPLFGTLNGYQWLIYIPLHNIRHNKQIAEVKADANFPINTAASPLKSGIDKSNFDPSIRPQDDLFRSVNGKWLREVTIPPDRPASGAFYELRDRSEQQVLSIIEAAAKTKVDSNAQKISDLYASFMDEARANKLGLAPLQPELDVIAGIKEKAGLLRALATLQKAGVPGLFGIYVGTDAKKSDQYITYINQGGLGLPNESYYRESKYDSLRTSYVHHIGKMLALAKVPNPDKAAAQVMAIETAIAKGHWDNVQTRDVDKTYNRFSLSQLKALAKGLDLGGWFAGLGAKGIDELVVREPSFMTDLAKTIDHFSMEDWKTYLTWRLVSTRAPLLSEPFVMEDFEFHSKILLGTPEIQPRWKRGVALVEGALGQAVGKLYVAKYFPPEAKEKMKVLVANLIEAYRIDIQALEWMSSETKAKALEKLAKFTSKIGYPDKWRDYSKLDIKPDDLVGNQRRVAEFELNYRLGKLGKPVDKTEWAMTPQTVNAYYNPGMNEIVFPAAILQPPFFDPQADDAVNYGGIGAVIGHEIGHGFDDQGAKYDGDGNLKDWWTAADKKEFQRRTKALIEQYNAFEPQQLPGQHVKGALTIGENIGDLGGLTIAYKAYMISLKGKEAATIDGFTGPQRLFIGWAQVWRMKYRDAALSRRLATDPHSPPEFRCNGVIRNLTEFYEAFGVKEGDRLWLPANDRVRIW